MKTNSNDIAVLTLILLAAVCLFIYIWNHQQPKISEEEARQVRIEYSKLEDLALEGANISYDLHLLDEKYVLTRAQQDKMHEVDAYVIALTVKKQELLDKYSIDSIDELDRITEKKFKKKI